MSGSAYFSLRAVVVGLIVLIVLVAAFTLLWPWGISNSEFTRGSSIVSFVGGLMLYIFTGYVAGAVARRHEVLNASTVGLLFGALIWLVLLLIADESPTSINAAGLSAVVVGVLACGVGGIVALLLRRRKRA